MKRTIPTLLLCALSLHVFSQDCSTPQTLPYAEDFTAGEPDCWVLDNFDSSAPEWEFNDSEDIDDDGTNDLALVISPVSVGNTVKNDYSFGPLFSLVAGQSYDVTVRYNSLGLGPFESNEGMELVAATAPEGASVTEVLASDLAVTQQGINGNAKVKDLITLAYVMTETFTPATTGDYYFGVHALGSATSPGIFLYFGLEVESQDGDCPGDLDGDDLVNINDFLILNSAYGGACDMCAADLNDDGAVGVDDFLIFNSSFGSDCN